MCFNTEGVAVTDTLTHTEVTLTGTVQPLLRRILITHITVTDTKVMDTRIPIINTVTDTITVIVAIMQT